MSSISPHHRRSIRLPEYDYSSSGAYFVTLVTHLRESILGEIVAGEMAPNIAGEQIWEVWNSLPSRYSQIEVDEVVVMPNHFHGILWINETDGGFSVGAIHELPQQLPQRLEPHPQTPEERRLNRRRMLLPLVMGYFKMNSSKKINQMLGSSGRPIWQRNYYERVIRNETELNAIRVYIQNNPSQWELDRENPTRYME